MNHIVVLIRGGVNFRAGPDAALPTCTSRSAARGSSAR